MTSFEVGEISLLIPFYVNKLELFEPINISMKLYNTVKIFLTNIINQPNLVITKIEEINLLLQTKTCSTLPKKTSKDT